MWLKTHSVWVSETVCLWSFPLCGVDSVFVFDLCWDTPLASLWPAWPVDDPRVGEHRDPQLFSEQSGVLGGQGQFRNVVWTHLLPWYPIQWKMTPHNKHWTQPGTSRLWWRQSQANRNSVRRHCVTSSHRPARWALQASNEKQQLNGRQVILKGRVFPEM